MGADAAEFYDPFAQDLAAANENMPNVKPADEATDEICDNCGSPMVIKAGRFGRFIACTAYPKCKTTKQLPAAGKGPEDAPADQATEEVCDQCGQPMVIKTGRFGGVYGVQRLPQVQEYQADENRGDLPALRRRPGGTGQPPGCLLRLCQLPGM